MRVLITGAGGFVGRHLARYVSSKKNTQVYVIVKKKEKDAEFKSIFKTATVIQADMLHLEEVQSVIQKSKPDRVFHLAGFSSVTQSHQSPELALKGNIFTELNLFQALLKQKINPLVHMAGSSEAYGTVSPDDIPVKESCVLRPLSPYGVSKGAQDLLSYQYFRTTGLRIIRTRAFNHTGPGQKDDYVASNFAKQVALIESGRRTPAVLYVGNLDIAIDFTDVRDIVRAYWLALEKGEPGEVYNVGTGSGHKISEIIEILLKKSTKKIKVKQDPHRLRNNDFPIRVGDITKFKIQTGWSAEIPFEQTIGDLLDYWRDQIANKKIQR